MASRPEPSATRRTGMLLPMRVWDLPVRLFHWLLVVLVVISYVSVGRSRMQVHMLAGQAVLVLVLFRIAWGFLGSDTARFARFLRSPAAVLRHLRHFADGRAPDTQVGHNEAGGWMVVALLALLLGQTGFGLFANQPDDFVAGPLARLVSEEWGLWARHQHGMLFNVLVAVVLLHIAAVVAYAVLRRHDLVRPMLTGKKRLPAATPAPRMASPLLALVLLVAAALLVWLLVTRL